MLKTDIWFRATDTESINKYEKSLKKNFNILRKSLGWKQDLNESLWDMYTLTPGG